MELLVVAKWQWIVSFIVSIISFLLILPLVLHGRKRLPPGPRPLPILGNLLKIAGIPHRSLASLAKTYGPLMSLKLGSRIVVVVSSPEMAKRVLHHNDLVFSGRPVTNSARTFDHNEASIAWLPAADQRWKSLRRVCATHLFSPQRVDASRDVRREKIDQLKAYLMHRSSDRQPVDIGRAAFATVFNLMSRLVFSVDLVDISSAPSQEFFKDLVGEVTNLLGSPNVLDFLPWLAFLDPQGTRSRSEAVVKRFYRVIDEQIDRRLQETTTGMTPPRKSDFLQALLQEKNDRHAIRSLLIDLFVAATDTTSSTIEWAMAKLLCNPEVMANVRRELDEKIEPPERDVEESDIAQLRYLQAVIKETLRMHTPAPFLLPHRAEKGVELCGYAIPKGACVLMNMWAIGRDEGIWADPDCFRPERFLESKVDFQGGGFELIVFGAGRRICPGMLLAHRMLHLTVATFVRNFDWKAVESMEGKDLEMMEYSGQPIAVAVPLPISR